MGAIQLYIDEVDFSEYIQQETDIKETMRRITGRAQGVAVDGTTVPDLVTDKWDPSFLLKPMPQSMITALLAKMRQETVLLRYTSVLDGGALRTITAMPAAVQVKYAMQAGGERIYDAVPIAFEEL